MSEKWNREKCQETGVQNCYYCETYDCCDNNTPAPSLREDSEERTCHAVYPNDSDYRNHPIPRCSECERPIVEYEDDRLANFCHYCGAKVVD